MNLRFKAFVRDKVRASLLLLPGLWLLPGCHHDSVVPNPVVDYFPVEVGTYRTYAVADSVWANARPTVTNYQLRERVTEQFTDAAGKTAYRLVRSRRASASAGWLDDSVFIVQPTAQAVLLTRNNVRTVELIYPARAGRGWNANALTGAPDTISSRTRFYTSSVGTPFTTPAFGGQPAKTYANTVSTKSTLDGGVDDFNALNRRALQQVYASGVGLVQRRRFSYATYTTNPDGSANVLGPKNVQAGAARYEVLLETGKI